MFLLFLLSGFFVRPPGRLLDSLSLASSLSIDKMLGDVRNWIPCVVWQAMTISLPHVLHHSRSLNMMEDVAYHVFLDFLVGFALFGVLFPPKTGELS